MGVEPENTLRSFVAAEEAGLDAVELDLHLSKDGALVVMHDARRGPHHGRHRSAIADKTLEELRALDAGRGERVPLFVEVLDAVRTPLQAEIKDVRAARALAEVMHDRGLTDRVEVASYHDEAIAEIARLVPGVRTALVARHYGPDVVDRAVAAGAARLCLDIHRITLEIVKHARKAGLPASLDREHPGPPAAGARAGTGRRDHRLPGDQTHRPLHR
ncbi:Glycerophosphodiester phosphodiesterase OS=Streptomyces tendae OX=1932 GN=F3L20_22610 PE=4 SV=1 [Streptomyces tendae]